MKEKKFKFEIGDVVIHAAAKSIHDPFIIVGRGFMDFGDDCIEETYTVSHFALGKFMRINMSASELVLKKN